MWVVCSVARAARGRTSLIALRRRLPALPHHASAGRVARAAGQAREPAASGRVASGRRCRARLSSRSSRRSDRVCLLPLLRERARTQSESDTREPAGQARLHAGPEHDGAGAASGAGRHDGAFRASEAVAGRAGRLTSSHQDLRHSYGAGRLPRKNRQCPHLCTLVSNDQLSSYLILVVI